jgi:uncharacterized protein YoxC
MKSPLVVIHVNEYEDDFQHDEHPSIPTTLNLILAKIDRVESKVQTIAQEVQDLHRFESHEIHRVVRQLTMDVRRINQACDTIDALAEELGDVAPITMS